MLTVCVLAHGSSMVLPIIINLFAVSHVQANSAPATAAMHLALTFGTYGAVDDRRHGDHVLVVTNVSYSVRALTASRYIV